MPHEIFRTRPFPFPGDRFPAALGAVIQRTVLDRLEPAREVIHCEDGAWLIGDGVNDPNLDGACVAASIRHVADDDPTVEAMATLEPGHIAYRESVEAPWQVEPHVFPDEQRG
jgi:hypothetical protein